MADATFFPSVINYAQWSRPGAENPRLSAPISSSATTITVTNALKDESGTVITGSFLMGCKDTNGYTESIWVPAGGASADGLTLTGVTRGVDLSGLDITAANDSTLAVAHNQDDPIFCQISGANFQLMASALQGSIGSGGATWLVGDNATAQDINFTAAIDQTTNPKFNWDDSVKRWKLGRGDDEGAAGESELSGFMQLTTTERDALTSVPTGGLAIYNTTVSQTQWREGGAWVTNAAGGTVADASETVAGKVELATNAEMGAGTSTGSTGARLLPPNDQLVKTSSGAGDENKILVLNASGQIATGFNSANLQEADTFFGATDITGAQAETLTDGSSANALHNHDGPEQLNASVKMTIWDNYQNTDGNAGTFTQLGGGITMDTDATGSGEYAQVEIDINSVGGAFYANSPAFFAYADFAATTAQDGQLGFGPGGNSNHNNTLTTAHAAFLIADAELVASVADGATQQKSAALEGTYPITTVHSYHIAENGGGNYLFYIDGVLVHTSSANEPSSGGTLSVCNIVASGAAAKTLRVFSHCVSFTK